MEVFLEFVNQNVHYAPYAICGLLLLAGLNIPVSEDLMIFTSALLAAKNPELTSQLFIFLLVGCYFSDLICYFFIGRFLGNRIREIKFFSKMITDEQIEKVSKYYKDYGVFTLIIGRFIPFGVRNALFITAGMSKMDPVKFSLSDLVACAISVSLYFYIYLTFGEAAVEFIKKSNVVIFGVFIVGAIILLISKRKKNG